MVEVIYEKRLYNESLRPKAFNDLIHEVIFKRICCKCGLCVSSCPMNAIEMTEEGPKLIGLCWECETCYYSCPRTKAFLRELLEASLDGKNEDEVLGRYIKIVSARTTLDEVKKRAQDGGVVSSLLIYAIKNEIVNGAVVASRGYLDPWKPVPYLALTVDDVLKSAGAKYSNCPNLVVLGDALYCYNLDKICVVGVPCQVAAARNVKVQRGSARKLGDIIAFIIGLFCMETFNHEKLLRYLLFHGIDIRRVSKFDIKEGRFKVYVGDAETLNVPVRELKDCVNEYCHVCRDLTALYSDISVGAIGSQLGWSTVIIRTSRGAKLFDDALKEGYLEARDIEDGKAILKRVAKRKATGRLLS